MSSDHILGSVLEQNNGVARDTDKDWAIIASENPYWGVISVDLFRGADLKPEAREQFFRSGDEFVANTIGYVTRHLLPGFKITRALDFGCGVGRLLLPLARISQEVVGVDVAPRMLEIARQNLDAAGLSNVSLALGADALSRIEGEFDFINSYIVFQHIAPERGIPIMVNLLNKLRAGGVFSLQLTYAKERKFLAHEGAVASYYRRSGTIMHDLVPTGAELPEGTILMFDYDLNEVMLVVSRVAREPIMMVPTNHDGHIGVHLIGMKAQA